MSVDYRNNLTVGKVISIPIKPLKWYGCKLHGEKEGYYCNDCGQRLNHFDYELVDPKINVIKSKFKNPDYYEFTFDKHQSMLLIYREDKSLIYSDFNSDFDSVSLSINEIIDRIDEFNSQFLMDLKDSSESENFGNTKILSISTIDC